MHARNRHMAQAERRRQLGSERAGRFVQARRRQQARLAGQCKGEALRVGIG